MWGPMAEGGGLAGAGSHGRWWLGRDKYFYSDIIIINSIKISKKIYKLYIA
jgi:hypothetical protein